MDGEWLQDLIQLAPALREAGVLRFGCGDKWAELSPAPPVATGESGEKADSPVFDLLDVRLRSYDAPGETSKP